MMTRDSSTVRVRCGLYGSTQFDAALSFVATLVGGVLGVAAILVAFLFWRHPRESGRLNGGAVALCVLAMAASVPAILIPFTTSASPYGFADSEGPTISCGPFVQPRTDFSQYPVEDFSNINIFAVSRSTALSACASVHRNEFVAASLLLIGGAGGLCLMLVVARNKRTANDDGIDVNEELP
jgi:hypothetical protein